MCYLSILHKSLKFETGNRLFYEYYRCCRGMNAIMKREGCLVSKIFQATIAGSPPFYPFTMFVLHLFCHTLILILHLWGPLPNHNHIRIDCYTLTLSWMSLRRLYLSTLLRNCEEVNQIILSFLKMFSLCKRVPVLTMYRVQVLTYTYIHTGHWKPTKSLFSDQQAQRPQKHILLLQ